MKNRSEGYGKPWRFYTDQNIGTPKGRQYYLDKALRYLGPFPHETSAAAVAARDFIDADGEKLPRSKELAIELITEVAQVFNVETHLAAGAPRAKHVLDTLSGLKKCAMELATALKQTDDFTREALRRAEKLPAHAEFTRLCKIGEELGLPIPSDATNPESDGSLVQCLDELAGFLDLAARHYCQHRGIDAPQSFDKGGGRNLFTALAGHPRWGLVYSGMEIFELFRPGEGTGYEYGPLHEFLMAVFGFATGTEPDEHSKLLGWLKQLSKPMREHRAIWKKLDAVRKEVVEVIDSPESEARERRLKEILTHEKMLFAEWDVLSQQAWPTYRPLTE